MHPLTISCVRIVFETMAEWDEAPWATTVNMLFIIAGCTDRSVIFNLYFWVGMREGDVVLMLDPIIGRMLQREGVECAIVPQRDVDQEREDALQEGLEALDKEDVLLNFIQAIAGVERDKGRTEHGTKRRMD